MLDILTPAQYRELSVDALETRANAIISELQNVDSEIATDVMEEQSRLLKAEYANRNEIATLRKLEIDHVRKGAGIKVASMNSAEPACDEYDTAEYRKAFMNYVCRGTAIQTRSDETTVTTDNAAVIPTTLMREIIRKMEEYGEIWNRVRKLNIQGGVEFPILDLAPTASWVAETTPSSDQNLETSKISFTYHQIECKLAQSLLMNVVAISEFEALFPQLAVEAIVKAIEIAIFNGTGSGQPLGILNDTRIPAANKREMTSSNFTWQGWITALTSKKAYRNGVIVVAQETWDMYMVGMVDDNGQPIARITYGINGEETYRFMGKEVITVETSVLPDFDSADDEDVFAVFFRPIDYAVNSNLQMRVDKWVDNDKNKVKNKATMILDGKLVDPNGVLLISKESL